MLAAAVFLPTVFGQVGYYRPRIEEQPKDLTIREGETAEFRVRVNAMPGVFLQWRKNGAEIAGATSSVFQIPSTVPQDSGTYDCVGWNVYGDRITTRTAALMVIDSGSSPLPPTLAGLIYSETITIGAFGDSFHRVTEFKRDGTWEDLAVFSSHRPAFDSRIRPRSAGTYSYRVVSASEAELSMRVVQGPGPQVADGDKVTLSFTSATSGSAQAGQFRGRFEFLSPAGAPLINQSSRAHVSVGRPLRSGFVLRDWCYVLVRAVGPTLANFGVSQPAADPKLSVDFAARTSRTNDNWSDVDAATSRIAQFVGAFPLEVGARDSALVLRLRPGVYVATAEVEGNDSGEVLLETYLFLAPGAPTP